MKITAKIKAGSHIDRHWKDRHQIAGQLCGVPFKLSPDGYIADGLDAGDMAALHNHASVQIEYRLQPPPLVNDDDVYSLIGDRVETEITETITDDLPVRTKRPYNRRAVA